MPPSLVGPGTFDKTGKGKTFDEALRVALEAVWKEIYGPTPKGSGKMLEYAVIETRCEIGSTDGPMITVRIRPTK